MNKEDETRKANFRFNMISTITYIIGIILLIQLFNLQIIHGEEYREKSNTKLTREATIEAARGSIFDRSGNILAGTVMEFGLDLYSTKADTQTLNNTILNMVNVLEKNEDSYTDTFPIQIDPFEFKFQNEENILQWKRNNKISEEATAEDCFYIFKEKYKIENQDISEIRKIISIRYEMTQNGYSRTKPLTISKTISRKSVIELSERGEAFAGINIVMQPVRTYYKGELASHVLGYIGKISKEEYDARKELGYENSDYIGKSGIEYVFEEYLKGQDGIKQIDMDVDGTITDEYVVQEATAGADVVLTIDARLQEITENALAENIQKIRAGGFGKVYDAKGGAAVVMNVKTGEILSLASYPYYEPELFIKGISNAKWQEYNTDELKALYNRAIQGKYAPGSIFKMVSAIAGLESGAITREERINDIGIYPYAHKPVCWLYSDYKRGHGLLNVSDAIKHSCNFFFYEVGRRMGIDTLAKYANYFGLGSKTGIELLGETSGDLASREKAKEWYLADTLSAVIGQSFNSFSPLQMTKYIGMVANGGKIVNPTVVKKIMNSDGTEVSKEETEEFVNNKLGLSSEQTQNLDIAPENISAVLEGMRSVTSETGGTAYSIFKNFNIEVGGKTGSAEADTYINAWFAGFAPFDDPEIAVVVLVENGGHGYYTAEVVRDIIKEYFGMNTQEVMEDTTALSYVESIR